jgi:hypothetical protein
MRKRIGQNVTGDLMPRTIHYSFTQSFNVAARRAFEWCTDYTPEDMTLVQEGNATREVQHIADDLIILVDTFLNEGMRVVKQKLVCLYPNRLTWTSTHLMGPNKYSQFLYEITPQTDKQCCLKFTASHLDYGVRKSRQETENLKEELKRTDSEIWKRLAKAMEKQLKE